MEKKPIHSRYRWVLLLTMCITIMSAYIDMNAYGPILHDIGKALNVDAGRAIDLMMGFILATAITLIWGGVICDKYGMTVAFVLGLLCVSVPAALMPWIGKSFGTVFVCRLIQGASIGFIFTSTGPLLHLWFPHQEHGIASGIIIGFTGVGAGLGGLLSPPIFNAGYSWQATVALLSIPGWAAMLLAIIFTTKAPPEAAVEALRLTRLQSQGQATLLDVFKRPSTWMACLVNGCAMWVLYCLINLVPVYMAVASPMGLGLGAVMSGRLSLGLTWIGFFGNLGGGLFYDKVAKGDARVGPAIAFVLACIFSYLILCPAVYSNIPFLFIALVIAGFGATFGLASVPAFLAQNSPPQVAGRVIGWVVGISTFFGAFGIHLSAGTIHSSHSFVTAITMISLAAVCGFIFSIFLKQGVFQRKPSVAVSDIRL
ncbi:MAG: MFS transporter [Syntrophobacteraceae bacterium]